ncbi:MAG: RNA polymerase sigma factor [Planctomycetota bacterium]
MLDTATAATIDWTEELERTRTWMLKVLRSRVGDAHAADDLLQEVAVAVLRQSSRPTNPGKVAPWLYRLTVRQAINFHRRTKRRQWQPLLAEQEPTADRETSPLEWIVASEQKADVQRALAKLKPRDREILLLKYTENWTYEELARHTGAKVKTIEYRLLKARQRLRRLIMQNF